VLLAIAKTPSLRTPSNLVILNLATTDFGLGISLLVFTSPAKIAFRFSGEGVYCPILKISEASFNVLTSASFLTLCLSALERFLFVNLHLRYESVVTVKRVGIAIGGTWAVSV
ncbi:predicted protein, partial [Nematostella vectensis]